MIKKQLILGYENEQVYRQPNFGDFEEYESGQTTMMKKATPTWPVGSTCGLLQRSQSY